MPFENEDHVGGIPEELRTFLNDLVTTFGEVTEIWVFGSRAERLRDARDWDVLVFSNDRLTHEAVAPHYRFRSAIYELFIAGGDEFRRPWPRERDGASQKGSFTKWKWVFEGDRASYEASGDLDKPGRRGGTKPAFRIWRR